MTKTEERMEILRLAIAGLRLEAPFMQEANRKTLVRALCRFYMETGRARRKLLQSRNHRALAQSTQEVLHDLIKLPNACRLCGAGSFYTGGVPNREQDFLHQCAKPQDFDCPLHQLRVRCSAVRPPAVPAMPALHL